MRLIFELQVQDTNLDTQLDVLKQNLRDIKKEFRDVDQGSQAFKELANEAAGTRAEIAKLTEQQKALKKEFAASQVPTDSLAGLRLEYSKLIDQITKLSKAERESEAGQALIQNASSLKGEINEIQESVGNFTGSVGNYKNGILAASDALGIFGGSLSEQAGILNTAVFLFETGSEKAKLFFDATKQGAQNVREGIGQFREYLQGLRETKAASSDAAQATGEVSDAVEETASQGVEAAKGLAESSKGARLFSAAGTVLKGVLASIGIGLIIALVVGLIGVFKQFSPVIDFVEKAVAGLSAVFDVLVSRAAKVFTALGKFLTGDFSGAFNDVSSAVSGIGSAMLNAATAAIQLTQEIQDLDDAQKDFVLTSAKAEAAVAKLSVALKDSTKSDSERLKIAAQITKIENENLATKTSLIDKEIDIEKRRLLLNGQVTKEQADQIAAGNFDLARTLEDEFKLKQDQTDKIRDLLVLRVQAESESATLLERTENRRNSILESIRAKQQAANDKAKAESEKRLKEIEAQAKRIDELSKSIRDLDVSTITNDFDRQSTEIENKRIDALNKIGDARAVLTKKIADQKGILSEADQREIALISEQTASIIAAYDQQQQAVANARKVALDKQQQELLSLSLELNELAERNAQRLQEAEFQIANSNFAESRNQLLTVLNERKLALTQQLADGTISQKRFNDEYLAAQEAFNVGTAELERNRAAKIKEVSLALEQSRIEAAKASLAVRLAAIKDETDAEIQALKDRETKQGGGNADAAIDAAKLRAIEKQKAAQIDFNNSVVDAETARKNAALEADRAINESDQQVSEDKLARLEREKEKRAELQGAILESSRTVASAIFEIEKNRIDNQLQNSITALDAEFERKRTAAAGNADQLAKIDLQYQRQKEELEKEAARKRKRIAITEAIINGALAVVKALPNLILAAVAAVATAAQIAVISSQNFAKGGTPRFSKSGFFGGRPHSQGGTKGQFDDGTNIEVEKDEMFIILNKRASGQIRQLSDFNYANGGNRFADGGSLAFTPQFQSLSNDSQQIAIMAQANFTDEQVDYFATVVADRTSTETRNAVATGLDDQNRLAERQQILQQNSEV